jgi:hypothetical protein
MSLIPCGHASASTQIVQVAHAVGFDGLALAAGIALAMGLGQPAAIVVVRAADALLDVLHSAGDVVGAAGEPQLDELDLHRPPRAAGRLLAPRVVLEEHQPLVGRRRRQAHAPLDAVAGGRRPGPRDIREAGGTE